MQEYDEHTAVLSRVSEYLLLIVIIEEAARLGRARLATRRARPAIEAIVSGHDADETGQLP